MIPGVTKQTPVNDVNYVPADADGDDTGEAVMGSEKDFVKGMKSNQPDAAIDIPLGMQ